MKKTMIIHDWINAAVFGGVNTSTTLNIVVNGTTRATLTATHSSINKGYYRFSDWSLNASGLSSISINITGIGIGSGAEVNFNGGVVALVDDFTTSYTLTTAELNAVKAAYIADTLAKAFAGTSAIKKVFAGTLQVFARQYLLTISTITGVANQTINRTASTIGAATGNIYSGAGGTSVTVYYGDVISITATAASGYTAPTISGSPVTITTDTNTASYITAGTPSQNTTITGMSDFDWDTYEPVYLPGTRTCLSSFSISVGSFQGKRKTANASVGYNLKKGTTTIKSGTSSSFALTSAEMSSLSGAGTITVNCTTAATQTYYYTANLSLTYTE